MRADKADRRRYYVPPVTRTSHEPTTARTSGMKAAVLVAALCAHNTAALFKQRLQPHHRTALKPPTDVNPAVFVTQSVSACRVAGGYPLNHTESCIVVKALQLNIPNHGV
jgi:hypothetical protein